MNPTDFSDLIVIFYCNCNNFGDLSFLVMYPVKYLIDGLGQSFAQTFMVPRRCS